MMARGFAGAPAADDDTRLRAGMLAGWCWWRRGCCCAWHGRSG
ncbi:MAG: hypothetical protein R2838_16185 [Caldilineaceae bacterium]